MDKWTIKSGRFGKKAFLWAIIGPGRLVYCHFRVIFDQYTPHVYNITHKDRYQWKDLSLWTSGHLKVADLAKKAFFLVIIGPGRLIHHHIRVLFGQNTHPVYIMTYKERYY